MLIRLIAFLAREFVTEYRKLDGVAECQRPHADEEPAPHDCASADTERAPGWDHDRRHPVSAARTGFGPAR